MTLRIITTIFIHLVCLRLAQSQTVTLQKTVDNHTAQSGEFLTYTIDYGCSSLTTDCVGAVLTDTLPPEVEFQSATPAIVNGQAGTVAIFPTYNSASHTVTWDFATNILPEAGLPDGSSGTVEIVVKIKTGVVPNNDSLLNKAVLLSTNAGTATDTALTVTQGIDPNGNWSLTKSVTSGNIYHDENVTYQLSLCPLSTIGNQNIHTIVVTDSLPAGAVFQSATMGGVHDGGTPGVVTWTFSDTMLVDGGCRNMEIVVQYPYADTLNNNTGLSTQIPKVNIAKFSALAVVDSTMVMGSDTVNDPLLPPFFSIGLTKNIPDVGAVPIDSIYKYILSPSNNSTATVNSFVLTDSFPDQFDLIRLDFMAFNTNLPVTLRAELNHSGSWTVWQTNVPANQNHVFDVTSIPGFMAGDFVSAVQIDFGNVPKGFGGGSIELVFMPSYPLDNAGVATPLFTAFRNTGYLTGINPFDGSGLGASDFADVCVVPGNLTRIATNKDVAINYVTTPAGDPTTGNPYFMGSRVRYNLLIENDGSDGNDSNNTSSVSQGPLIDPIVADLLPAGMTYEAGSYQIVNNTTGLTFDNSGTNPTFELIPNFNGTGKTLLRWRFTGTFEVGESAQIQYNAFIDSSNPAGTVLLNEYAVAMDTLGILCDANFCGIPDTTGLLNFFATASNSGTPIPGVTNFCANEVQIVVADTTSAPRPSKNILSSGPYAPAETPNVELGLATDTVEYSIQLCNHQSANYTMPNPVLMDLLPTELEYVPNSIVLTSNTTGLALNATNPLIEVIPDFQSTGRTMLRWTFTGEFPINKCVSYSFKARIKPGSGGTIVNEPLASVGDRVVSCTGELVENLDFNGNSIVGDTLCTAVVNPNFSIPEIRSLRTKKFVKGAKNSAYLGSDLNQLGIGCTYHGDSVLWRFKISNPGNVSLTNAVVVDVFPYIGDVGVKLNTTPRLTEWVPYLVDTIRSPNPNIKIWYSESTDPCRPEVDPIASTPCVNDWTLTVPANLANVKAVKFDFQSEVLSPGEEYWFDISMLAPDSIEMNPGVAWNSAAGDAAEVPSNEPNKVGIIINGFDLALRKTLASGQTYLVDPGSNVTYTIKIFNQGTDSVKNIRLIDYIPVQMTLNDPNWTAAAGNTAIRTIPGPLAPDDSLSVNITLALSPAVVTGDSIDNFAEITDFEDMAGNHPNDWDAVNDTIPNNDAGGTIESPADDAINGNGQGTVPGTDPDTDEDDHDGARVRVCPSFTQNSAQDQEVCTDNLAALADIVVPTTANSSEPVKFVAFASQQSPPNMYSGGTTLAIVNPSGGHATLPAALIPTALGTHYIYAILEPAPTDPNCRPYDLVVVRVNLPVVASAGADVEICDGFSTTLTASATGGNGNYSYSWSNGANGASTTVSPSPAGVYTYIVTVTDSSGNCADVDSVQVTVNPNPTVSAGADIDTCVNASVTISALPSGGTPGYTYLWSNGNTAQTQLVMVADPTTFTVTVTDTKGCTAVDAMNINVPVANAGPDAAICLNDSTTLTASGGLLYSWSNGGNTASITVSPAATTTYYVTVTDAIGCTDVDSTVVTVYSLPSVDAGPDVEICNGKSTNLTATGSGGTPGYTYAWDQGLGNGASKTVSPTTTTTYHVTITDSHGCTGTDSVTVIVNPLPTANAGADTTVCLGTTATIMATATGGTPGYTYTWNQGLGAGQSHTFTPSVSRNYTVTVTDSKGCTDTDVVRVYVQSPTANAGPDQAICLGDTATLTASGGVSYVWSTGDSTASIVVAPINTASYSVTVTDALGCTDADTAVVTVNPLPTPGIAGSLSICEGESTVLTAYGGTSYLWSTGATTAAITVAPLSTTLYSVTVTDANNCSADTSATVVVRPVPVAQIAGTTTICFGQNTTLTATGGGTYLWNTGATTAAITVAPSATTTYSVTVTDANGCTDAASVTVTVNSLPAAAINGNTIICEGDSTLLVASGGIGYLWNNGQTNDSITVSPSATTTYSVTVTDANGCTDVASATVVVNPLPVPSISGLNVICFGDSTLLTASGGTSYLWSNGATSPSISVAPISSTTYSVTVTDDNGCSASASIPVIVNQLPVVSISGDTSLCVGENTVLIASGGIAYQWSTGATTAAINVAPSLTTTYSVTVTGTNGCTATGSTTVNVHPLPTASINGDTVICLGDATTLTASGAQYYLWNTGDTTASIVVAPLINTTYHVTVTTQFGCSDTESTTVHLDSLPVAVVSGADTICLGDATTLTASGGNSYLWSTGATTASITVSPAATTSYSVTVTDDHGCSDTASFLLTVLTLPTPTITGDTAICFGETTTLIASGGVSYLWSTGDTTASIAVSPSATTTYSVTATDANGCSNTTSTTLIVHPLPPAAIVGDTLLCLGDSTILTAVGGLSYFWSTGASTASIVVSPTATTHYNVFVTDANGCTDTAGVTVVVNNLPVAVVSGDSVICMGQTAFLTAFGGTNFLWSTGDTTASIAVTPSANTSYSVTVSLPSGCSDVATHDIAVLPLPTPAIFGDTTICRGDTVLLTALGGGSYLWNTGGTTSNIEVVPNSTTLYSVTVSNQYGCSATATHLLTVNQPPSVVISGGPYHCYGDTTVLTASGGVSYLWSTGASTASIAVAPSVNTNYGVLVTGANGCTSTGSITLEVQFAEEIFLADTICQGEIYYFFGQPLTAAGIYHDTLFYTSGCDSVRYTLSLYVRNNCVLDLALRKTPALAQVPLVTLDDTVTFTITVFNQGTEPAYNIQVLDYKLPSFTYDQSLNPGWFDFGGGPAWIIPGPLAPGDSIANDIKLVVNLNALDTNLVNFAEITSFDNDTNPSNTPPTDLDSNPDAFNGNDAGGQIGSAADDYIFGNGTGTPGDGVATTDEDDHDGAQIQFLPPPPLSLGNLVFEDFDNDGLFNNNDVGIPGVTVELYNAGPDGLKGTSDDYLVDSTVTDAHGHYLFTGLSHGLYWGKLNGNGIPPGYFSSTGQGPHDMDGMGPFEPAYGAFLELDNADDGTQMGSMVMTDTIRLFYWTEPTFEDGDENSNLTLDFGLFCPSMAVFDLALYKDLAAGQSTMVDIKDDIDYTICVVNEGNVTAYDLQVLDVIPTGMILSPNDANGWTLISPDSAVITIPGALAVGDTACVNIKLRLIYALGGANLRNNAEIFDAKDVNGDPLPDIDSTPANGNPNEDDIDEVPITVTPHNPTGWIYCEATGEIVTGGMVTVSGPGVVFLVADGSDGYYEFYTDGTPGVYTITYNHPSGYPMSTTCLPQAGPFDPTGLMDPVVVGSDTLAGALSDPSCVANPYYMTLMLEPGDPLVTLNNLPVQCVTVGSIVCEDSNNNDSTDVTDPPVAGITVYLYTCADTLNPIAVTVTDSLGQYSFTGLPAGNYRVFFDIPAGYRPVSTGLIAANGFSPCMSLNWGQQATNLGLCLYLCPPVSAGPDPYICLGNSTTLTASVPYGSGSFNWTPSAGLSNPTAATTIANPTATTTYVVTYSDGLGCADTDTVTVYTEISIPTLGNIPDALLQVECGQTIPWDAPVFYDLCDTALTIVFDSAVVVQQCGYDLQRTWTAINRYGMTASFNQLVQVRDTTPPVFTFVPADTTLASCSDMILMPPPVASDNCDGDVSITVDETMTTSSNCAIILTKIFTATDDCGNTATATQVITTYDTQVPQIVVTNPMLNGLQNGDTLYLECQAVGNLGPDDVTVIDDCGNADVVFLEYDAPLQNCASAGYVQFMRCGWNATDICGNQDSLFFYVVVIDTTPPQLYTVPANLMLMCNDPVPSAPTVYAVDNCDNNVPVNFTETTLPGTIVRSWTATDDCGNTVVGTQTISFDDGMVPPVIYNVPADTSISCDDPLPAPDPSVYAFDACDPTPALIVNDSIVGGGCGYAVYRTWTATDFDGNSSSATQVITVTDTLPPVLSGIPSELTIECGEPLPPVVYPTATDNCDTTVSVNLVVLVNNQDSCDIVVNRIFTATDDCGNQAGFHQHIHLIDTSAPVITVTHPQLQGVASGDTLTFECNAVPILDDDDAFATDGCDQAPLLFRTEVIVSQPNCQGEDYVMLMRCGWLAQDQCGNQSEWYVYFLVVDTQAPEIAGSLPADITVDCGNVPDQPSLDSIVVTDYCDPNPVLNLTDVIISGGCPGDYTILRTLTATDDCGNVASLTQTITVEDQTPPVINGVPADVTVDCGNIPVAPLLSATDNCDSNPVVTVSDVRTNGCPYTIFRTWTATDACGNSSSVTQRIRVMDSQPPVFDHLPADTTVSCNSIPPADVLIATDNCDTLQMLTFGETTSGSSCNYTITRTWTATDDCGNTFVHTQEIQVLDDEAPTFSSTPADITVACGNVPPAAAISISDNCDPAPVLTFTELTGSGCPYSITRIWTATDVCGNADSIVQVITVVDTQPPQILGVPANATIQCGDALPSGLVTAIDNCTDSVVVQFTEVADSTDPCDVVVTRTWLATDDCGNVATATQTIHIIDTLAPAIVFNHPWLSGLQDGDTLVMDCSNTEVFGAASADAVDQCNDAVIGFTEGSVLIGDCEDEGFLLSLNCKWTATDACGNSASVTITMVIVDTLPPVFSSVPADLTVNCGEPVPPFGVAVATDACGDVLISAAQDTVADTNGYRLVRTYTAIDDCGNVATATQNIYVLDSGAPTLIGVPADTTIYSNQGQTTPNPPVVVAIDDCTGDTIPVTFTEFTGLVPGGGCDTLLTRIWTTTDGAGNTVADTQLIVVVGGYDVTVIAAPDTCGFGNGSVLLQPDTLNYLWSDSYVGAFRDSLSAGTYTVYVSDGGCTDTLVFEVPSLCPCIAPVVDSIEIYDATCGNADGAANILLQGDADLYNYYWLPNHGTPNLAGNGRTNLPAGHYVVIVEQPGLDSCFAKVEFTIGDNCPDCAPLFTQDSLVVGSPADPANVCVPVPYAASQGYSIYVDGALYTLPLGQCNNETVLFYTYALVTGQGQTGPYDVQWIHGMDTLMTIVNNMDELVAAMNAVDSAGMWYNQPHFFGLTSMNIGGSYGDMFITHIASQNTAMISPNFTSTPMGTEIILPAGVHQVVYVNQTDGCSDTLTVVVNITPPLPGDIFFEKLVVNSGNCDYTDMSTCLDIAYSDLPKYDFELNGQPFTGAFDICNFNSEHYYTYVSVPGLGAAGPYTLEDWSINGQHFSGVFDDMEELVALMNSLDPIANWQLNEQAFVIVGGGNNQYGPLKVRQNSTGAVAVMDVNTNTSAGQARVTLPEGENTFVAIRKADGFSDTLRVMVACVHSDYFSNVIDMNQVDTICLDLDEIMGEVIGVENICQNNSAAAQLNMISGTWCLQCIGMQPGQTSACYVLCDEYGICDTTYIDVEVRAVSESETQLHADNLTTLINQPVTADVLANDQIPAPVLSLNIVTKPQHGTAVVNEDNTITYVPLKDYCNDYGDATPDHFLYEVCTADGCYTSVVWVNVKCSDLVIFSGFSPNGDGVNDTFVIEGLQKYPNHSLRIFNRWGNLVFKTKDYRNDWGGTWGQNDLPDGTYFYLLDLGDGTQYSGFIQINR